jgi:hypothetical protein
MAEVDGEDDSGEEKQSPTHTGDGDDKYFEVEAIKSCKLSSRVRRFLALLIFILTIPPSRGWSYYESSGRAMRIHQI